MALSDMYEIKVLQTYLSENVLNVFHVQKVSAGFTALSIAEAYGGSISAVVRALQNPVLSQVEIQVQNLDDATDFDTLATPAAVGTRVGSAAPTSLAAELRFPRRRTDMRDGFKRFSGISEETFSGQVFAAAFITSLDAVGAAMLAPWERAAAPGIPVCNYVIIKRLCTVQPPPDPCPSYRLPEDDIELIFYIPTASVSKETVRTQVSRRSPAT